jgi:Peptidase M50B-like
VDWQAVVVGRVVPADGRVALEAPVVAVALAAALVVVGVSSLWRVLRIAVTLVHELGHALVGMAVGRRFTGFVLRGDMSGHAVTVGPSRGAGRVVTTWAGYPAPALVGAVMVGAATRGWAAPLVTATLAVLVLAVLRVRTLLTAVVVLVAVTATGALWWWRDDDLQAVVLVGLGVVLVVGAWRHLGAVVAARRGVDDPSVLATLTHVPRLLWTTSFVVVCGAATAFVLREVAAAWQ